MQDTHEKALHEQPSGTEPGTGAGAQRRRRHDAVETRLGGRVWCLFLALACIPLFFRYEASEPEVGPVQKAKRIIWDEAPKPSLDKPEVISEKKEAPKPPTPVSAVAKAKPKESRPAKERKVVSSAPAEKPPRPSPPSRPKQPTGEEMAKMLTSKSRSQDVRKGKVDVRMTAPRRSDASAGDIKGLGDESGTNDRGVHTAKVIGPANPSGSGAASTSAAEAAKAIGSGSVGDRGNGVRKAAGLEFGAGRETSYGKGARSVVEHLRPKDNEGGQNRKDGERFRYKARFVQRYCASSKKPKSYSFRCAGCKGRARCRGRHSATLSNLTCDSLAAWMCASKSPIRVVIGPRPKEQLQ